MSFLLTFKKINDLFPRYLATEEEDKQLEPKKPGLVFPYNFIQEDPSYQEYKFSPFKTPGRLFEPLIRIPINVVNLLSENKVMAHWNYYQKSSASSFVGAIKAPLDRSKMVKLDDFHLVLLEDLFNDVKPADSFTPNVSLATMLADIEISAVANICGKIMTDISSPIEPDNLDTKKWYSLALFFRGLNVRIASLTKKIANMNVSLNDVINDHYLPKEYEEYGITSTLKPHLFGVLELSIKTANHSYLIVWSQDYLYFSSEDFWVIDRSNRLNHMISIVETSLATSFLETRLPQFSPALKFIRNLMFDQRFSYDQKCSFSASFEPLCLQLTDLDSIHSKSSVLPLIDTLTGLLEVEGIQILNEDLLEAMNRSVIVKEMLEIIDSIDVESRPMVGSLHKNSLYKIDSIDAGLNKYHARTSRDWKITEESKLKLKCMFRKKFIFGYLNRYKKLPPIECTNDVARHVVDELSQYLTLGNHHLQLSTDYRNFEGVKFLPILTLSNKVNVESRLIDKSCTATTLKKSSNSVKEIIEYMEREDPRPVEGLIDRVPLCEIPDRKFEISDTLDSWLGNDSFYVRLHPKEREQKDYRFFGIGSYDLKLTLSSFMELCKKPCSMIDGQMLTMSTGERDRKLHLLGQTIRDPNKVCLMADISGHNQSERPGNMVPILEEINDLFGIDNMDRIAYVFNYITVFYESPESTSKYLSRHQLGAIEGWYNALWCLQSSLIMDIISSDRNYEVDMMLSYSDDMAQDITMEGDDADTILLEIKQSFKEFGFLVKFSQTTISDKRATMLKKTYINGLEQSTEMKRILAFSMFSSDLVHNDLFELDSSNSAFSSCLEGSINNRAIIEYRWLRTIPYLIDKFTAFLLLHFRSIGATSLSKMFEALCQYENKEISQEMVQNHLISSMYSDGLGDLFYAFCVLPSSIQGFGMIPYLFAAVSGYSDSFVKRCTYSTNVLVNRQSVYKTWLSDYIFSSLEFSKDITSVLNSNFPIVSKRAHPVTFMKSKILDGLSRQIHKIRNKVLKEAIELKHKDGGQQFKMLKLAIIETFNDSFNFRIAQKFLDCAYANFVDYIINKIASSTTVLRFTGDRIKFLADFSIRGIKVSKIEVKPVIKELNQITLLNMRNQHYYESFNITYTDVEEVIVTDILDKKIGGNIVVVELRDKVYNSQIKEVYRGYRITKGIKPKYRDTGIDWYFVHYMHYKMFELARYSAWLIEDQRVNSNTDYSLQLDKLSDIILSEYTTVRISELRKYIALPYGGQILHRTDNSGFKNSSNIRTLRQKAASVYPLNVFESLAEIGTTEHNINVELLNAILILKKVTAVELGYTKRIELAINKKRISLIKDARVKLVLNETTLEINDMLSYSRIDTDFRSNLQVFIHASKLLRSTPDVDEVPVLISEGDLISSDFITMCKFVSDYMDAQNISTIRDLDKEVLEKILHAHGYKIDIVEFLSRYESNWMFRESYHDHDRNKNIRHTMTKKYLRIIENSLNGRRAAMKIFIINTCLSFIVSNIDVTKSTFTVTCNPSMSIENYKNLFHRYARTGNIEAVNQDMIARVFSLITIQYLATLNEADIIHELCRECSEKMTILDASILPVDIVTDVALSSQVAVSGQVKINFSGMLLKNEQKNHLYSFRKFIDQFSSLAILKSSVMSFESSTGSGVYHTAKGLMQHFAHKDIADLTAGRGDFHKAMADLGIKHTSVRRKDVFSKLFGHNDLIERSNYNAFSFNDIADYMTCDLFLYDISYATDYNEAESCLLNILAEGKEILLRMNQFPLEKFDFSKQAWSNIQMSIYFPSGTFYNSGYCYLHMVPGGAITAGHDISVIKKAMFTVAKGLMRSKFNDSEKPVCDSSYEEMSDRFIKEAIECDEVGEPDVKCVASRLVMNLNTNFADFVAYNSVISGRNDIDWLFREGVMLITTQANLLVTHDISDYAAEHYVIISKDMSIGAQIMLQSKAVRMNRKLVTTDNDIALHPFLVDAEFKDKTAMMKFIEYVENINLPEIKKKRWVFFNDLLMQYTQDFKDKKLSELHHSVVQKYTIEAAVQSKLTSKELIYQVKYVARKKLEHVDNIAESYLQDYRPTGGDFDRMLKSERKLLTRLRQLEKRIDTSKLSRKTISNLMKAEFDGMIIHKDNKKVKRELKNSMITASSLNEAMTLEEINSLEEDHIWANKLLQSLILGFSKNTPTGEVVVEEEQKVEINPTGFLQLFPGTKWDEDEWASQEGDSEDDFSEDEGNYAD